MEQTIKYKGYQIKIVRDTDPMNPRTDWDNAGVMCCWHRRYNLADMQNGKPISSQYNEPVDLLYELAELNRDDEQELREGNDISIAELLRIIKEEKGTIILPLYLYDHSGITISTSPFSCSWDSGQIGWIYMTKETMEKEKWTKEQAEKYLEGEVEVYDQYLTGDVWGYQVLDEDENIIESCYGYYGDTGIEDAIQEGKSHIDYRCKKEQEEYEKQPKKKAAELHTV